MDLNLAGKRALVCGSSQGIGQCVATELALLGCEITLLARNSDKLTDVAKSLPSTARPSMLVCDVTDKVLLEDLVRKEIAEKGPILILVNNSGGPKGGAIAEASQNEFKTALDQHLYTSVLLTQLLLPEMKSHNFGRIINIVSTSVKVPLKGLGVSNSTRAAVAAWSKTLASEIAPFGITVNCVLPGATRTQRLSSIIENRASKKKMLQEEVISQMLHEIPAGRFGQPQETAALAAFLCTKAAAYITGTAIPVDGGRTGCL